MIIEIRKYKDADKKDVRKIILDELKEFGFDYNPEYDFDLDDPEKHYVKSGGIFYVLTVDEKIVGTVAVRNKGAAAELKRLYLNREFQGKGLGSNLFDKAIEFCKQIGFKKIEFETNKKFKKAHLLYLKRGFKVVREDQEHFYMERKI